MKQQFTLDITVNEDGHPTVKLTKGHGDGAGRTYELSDFQIGFRMHDDREVTCQSGKQGEMFVQGKTLIPNLSLRQRITGKA